MLTRGLEVRGRGWDFFEETDRGLSLELWFDEMLKEGFADFGRN